MSVSASEIFKFLEQNPVGLLNRVELIDSRFDLLRHQLSKLIVELFEVDDHKSNEIASRFRALLSVWLTAPVNFDDDLSQDLKSILPWSNTEVTARWGRDCSLIFSSVLEIAGSLAGQSNPMRAAVLNALMNLSPEDEFRIYCHRADQRHYASIQWSDGRSVLRPEHFLSTATSYRDLRPVDLLIRCGPLKSRGWNRTPDAVLTAPRQINVTQIVWRGCSDDSDFGYDPIDPSSETRHQRLARRWHRSVKTFHSDYQYFNIAREPSPVDSFALIWQPRVRDEIRPSTLVEISSGRGILFPSRSAVLSFDPLSGDAEALAQRIARDQLKRGMFIVIPALEDVDLGGTIVKSKFYCATWKECLRQVASVKKDEFAQALRAAGMQLVDVESAIGRWCDEPTSVISAPQRGEHFEILIHALADFAATQKAQRELADPVWRKSAWIEVRKSRGDAIQAGFQEQEIVEELLLESLKKKINDIRLVCAEKNEVHINVSSDVGIPGLLSFFKIVTVDNGFAAPETEFRKARSVLELYQWRG